MSYSYREAALNWLALGLLLAAWNASDDAGAARDTLGGSREAAGGSAKAPGGSPDERSGTRDAPRRPAALRGYAQVSVRAATRTALINRGFTVM